MVGHRTVWGQPPQQSLRAQRFLAGRTATAGTTPASAMDQARQTHLDLIAGPAVHAQSASPRINPLSAAWTALGPAQVLSQTYGAVTGRVTSVAIDPSDPTGNTVYLGTTGGGVWKSTNAAGPAASVTFAPLTDTLPVFSANSGTAAIPSLSIGAVSAANGILLAGTGDPNDALDSYYGQGILRSTDHGVTWTLTSRSLDGVAGNHSFVGLGIAGFAWSTLAPNLVVMAVSQAAEGALNNAPNATNSVMGLYYSADAGVTWQMGTIEDGAQIVQRPLPTGANLGGNAATAVVWNAQRGRFYAAVRYHGYYESVDGITWTRLAHQPGSGLTIAACPTNPAGIGSTGCPMFRGALTVQPATGDTFALSVDGNTLDQGLWQDVCGGAGNGAACPTGDIAFATRLPSTALETSGANPAIPQGDYNLTLAAVSTGTGSSADTLLFAGAVDLFRCTLSSGCVLRNTTNAANGCGAPAAVAPAQHALATLANAGTGGAVPLVYIGNDGGLWRSMDGVNQQATPCSTDDATHFQNLNPGLGSLAEIVSFAQHPYDPNTLLAGLGANGSAATTSASTAAAWPQLSSGQGGAVAIDPANPANWYISTEAGVSLRACSNGSACTPNDFAGTTIGYAQVADDASLITPPLLLDPGLTSDVLVGTCRVWRGPAQDSSTWPGGNAISAEFAGPQNAACSASSNGFVRALGAGGAASGSSAAQDAGSTVLYAGLAGTEDGGASAGGHLYATSAGSTASRATSWTDIARSPVTNDVADAGVFNPGGFDVSSIAADSHDATGKTVYATVMGFTGNSINAPHVYGSTDGGAHWLNLSSNLPNAPANSIVVDPNDANTVYVAMDTGIYVTTSVTTCSSANCWSVYGTNLPNAPVVGLEASGTLSTGDGRVGELRAATYGRGIWGIPLLTAATPSGPALAVTPGSLTFATQAVSTASAAQTVIVTNTGSSPLTVSSVAVTGDFSRTTTCTAATSIFPGATCAVSVQFLPTATGARSGVLTVYGNVPGGQATVQLSGTGTPPAAIILNPILVSYPSTNVGAISAVQNITVSNTGGLAATLGAAAVAGDFAVTANTCGATLAASTGCTVSVVFKPTASGARSGSFTISGSAGTQTAALSGTGTLPATDGLSPTALVFGPQQLNTASAAQAVTLTNTGDLALQLIAASITAGDFTVSNACGNSLNGHASCTLQVAFVPKSVGPQTGVLTLSDQYRTQTVSLNGTGVAPPGVSLTPAATLNFGAVGLGASSAGQTVTLTNNGGLLLTLQGFTLTGDFAAVPGSNTCGASLAPSSACTVQVVFTPTVGGVRSGTISVADNASGSPQSVALTGTGIDFTLAANGPTSFTITAGQQAVFPLLLSSAAGVPGTVTFTCAPVPAHATCNVNPSSAALGATSNVIVTVATSVLGAQLHSPLELPDGRTAVLLAGLLPLGLLAARRKWAAVRLRLRLTGVAALVCLTLLAGCSASRIIPESTISSSGGASTPVATPTPPGTYTVTVTGASSGLSRAVSLTLIVQ